jgi:hypothetical protein
VAASVRCGVTVGASESSPGGGQGGGGTAAKLSGDKASVGRVGVGPAELQGDRGARGAAEAAGDFVEGPG